MRKGHGALRKKKKRRHGVQQEATGCAAKATGANAGEAYKSEAVVPKGRYVL